MEKNEICFLSFLPFVMALLMVVFVSHHLINFYYVEKEIKVYEKGAFSLNAKSWMFNKQADYFFINCF